jgi:hypothetical protein
VGEWFALEHWALEPDFVLVGKALSGGYMPVAAGLYLVEDEHRAVAPTQLLGALQISRRREHHHAALDRLNDEGGDIPPAQLCLQAREIAERNALAVGQQRAEAILEELVTDQRERAQRDAVKAVVAGHQPRSTRRGPRELHRCVHGLGARAREEHGIERRRQALRQCLGTESRSASSDSLPCQHEVNLRS